MIEIQRYTDTLPLLEEIRSQKFSEEKAGHPEVTFPNRTTCPLLFDFFSQRAKALGKNLVFIHANRFRLGDSAPWHSDLEEGTDSLGMLYLTANEFDLKEGGLLQLGYKVGSEVLEISSLTPNSGNFVLLDNTDASLVHRVTPLLEPKERYSVVGFFGTRESLL